ncbi:MAG: OmpA family protein [Bacteroidota bacterium]|nr:OmpA family protein [Bacteroidota bacterium]MDQ6889703.1 OmpA family protein [Bacteroidota bacterium]
MKKNLLFNKYLLIASAMFLFSSCVAKRYLTQSQQQTAALREDSAQLANKITALQGNIATLENNVKDLNAKIANLNSQNSQLGQQTAEQQNQLSQSKETLEQQRQRLQQLQNLLAQQKAQSDELKNKMTEALKGFNSNDLSVFQKNGKVYVRLSENLLFPSGSAVVNPKGIDALSKLAAVLNLNSDVAVNIEGHTDSIPIRGRFKDNWDLSTARANAIVRVLVDNYKVDPVRVVASGHSYYDPIDTNSTAQGRAQNRRTEIILSPKLDEMYKLLGQQ